MTSITAVVPWHNHPELSEGFWKAMSVSDIEVLVIDNASDPALPNAHRLDHNAGFCKASNIGLGLARTDAVLFLNNDIVATRAGWVEPIRQALEPGVLVGPIRYAEGHPYIDGWCLAGMREDLLELGGFDESLEEPAYFSDVLLSLEARAAGMTLRDVRPGLRHLENQTAGPANRPDVVAASAANRRLFCARVAEYMEVAA